MEKNKAIVARIRPVSWKLCVAGEDCANYVRSTLYESGIDSTASVREPDLHDPPIYSFIATPKEDSPLTATELKGILDHDNEIEVAFEL